MVPPDALAHPGRVGSASPPYVQVDRSFDQYIGTLAMLVLVENR